MITEKHYKIIDFVTLKHGDQKRKYTGEPYVNHLLNVANTLIDFGCPYIEVALCHDLFEDTDTDFGALHKFLTSINYSHYDAYVICRCVKELTDKFTHEEYPYLNRDKRKRLEAERLATVSEIAQTVKYADLIDNSKDIMQNDPKFAVTYLKEKRYIISLMRSGDKNLLSQCEEIIK